MAAGLGFKDFTTGEVLTANDVDGYLMQGIWVFASAAARDAAVTSPQEGNACYLKDTDVIMVYSGSTWATQSASNPISANIVDAKGDLIAATAADTVARLAVGTNGQVLTADSTAATGVAWAAASGSSWTSLGSGSLSSNILTLSSISNAYKDLRVVVKNVQVASAADVIVNANSSTNIDYLQVRAANTTVTNDAVTATVNWYLNNNQLNTGSNGNIVVLEFPNYAETTGYKIVNSRSRFFANSQSQQMIAGATVLTTSAISEIVIKTGGANFAGGTYEIWGIK